MAASEANYFVDIALPIATFIAGFLASRFTLSKSDKLAHKQRLYENAMNHVERQRSAYQAFASSLRAYVSSEDPGLDLFTEVATSGDHYFRELKMIGEAILSGNVDEYVRDETLVPALKEAIEKSLPAYYEALNEIAKKKGFKYSGFPKRSNYESIYSAVEKFA
ncbi:MAG: hypothetical protein ACOY3X_00955 [Pseudomonadota bacterium]